MKKVVVEIDGVRHQLMHGRTSRDCLKHCSLYNDCCVEIDPPCIEETDSFVLEETCRDKR